MKILLDTDIGSDIDDALALLLLLRLPDIELLGVTTVYGCTDVRAKVCKTILDAAGNNAPVFAGESTPLISTIPVWHAGTEGHGVLNDDEFDMPLDAMGISRQATEFIVDTVRPKRDNGICARLRRPTCRGKIGQGASVHRLVLEPRGRLVCHLSSPARTR